MRSSFTKVHFTLVTHRRHQLRLHSCLPPPWGLGSPIFGDPLYTFPIAPWLLPGAERDTHQFVSSQEGKIEGAKWYFQLFRETVELKSALWLSVSCKFYWLFALCNGLPSKILDMVLGYHQDKMPLVTWHCFLENGMMMMTKANFGNPRLNGRKERALKLGGITKIC